MSEEVLNYMPAATEEFVAKANELCNDAQHFSDVNNAGKVSNLTKWETIKQTYPGVTNISLFTPMDYPSIYTVGPVRTVIAGSYMADLRCQLLESALWVQPTHLGLHLYYILNKQWYVRLRETANVKSGYSLDARLT